MAKTFVVGYPGSGTRVIQQIARRAGIHLGRHLNGALDLTTIAHLPFEFARKGATDKDPCSKLKAIVELETRASEDTWCVKAGHFLIFTPGLRLAWPELKIILVVRHGLDNILNHFAVEVNRIETLPPHHRNYSKDMFSRLKMRARMWNTWHQTFIDNETPHWDKTMIVRLEDLVGSTKDEIVRILNFLEVTDSPEEYLNIVKHPKTMGRRFQEQKCTPARELYIPEEHAAPLLEIMSPSLKALRYDTEMITHG
tara:strand:+ start:341 stop:1102 length:762 start_codon:yes stop_codon:yes gene_type:complete